jgi:tRNA-splicing ligase RtcB
MANAANLALANRLALTLMAFSALQDELGADLKCSSVGDAAHNLIWPLEGGRFRHRKGACPAESGAGAGEPAFIPGSMGDSSWVLAGAGNEEMLSSAAHGAGRLLSRSKAARVRESTHDPRLRVVTPVDPLVLTRSGRRDLIHEQERRLREEAPYAYKPVEGVVAAVVAAGAARRVCRLRPLLTVKG